MNTFDTSGMERLAANLPAIRQNMLALTGKPRRIMMNIGMLAMFRGTSLSDYFPNMDYHPPPQNAIRALYDQNEKHKNPETAVEPKRMAPTDITPGRILSAIPDICVTVLSN